MDNWVSGRSELLPPTDGDWLDYYHAEFRGFNIVYVTSAAGDLTVDYYLTTQGWWWPAADGDNYEGGQLYQQDVYQGDTATDSALLSEMIAYYLNTDAPANNPYEPLNGCNGLENPVYTPCVVAPLLTKTTYAEGQGLATTDPWVQTISTYDDVDTTTGYIGTSTSYHNLLKQVTTTSDGQTLTRKWGYASTNGTSNSIFYYDVNKVTSSEIDDGSGHVWQCQTTTYDEGRTTGIPNGGPSVGLPTTVSAASDCTKPTTTALSSYTGYDQYGNVVATVDAVGVSHPGFYTKKGCSLDDAPVRFPSAWTATHYTSCATYDTAQTAGLLLTGTNALGQSASTVYDYTSAARPSSTTDPNSQTTSYSYSYDGDGNPTVQVTAPLHSGSYTTQAQTDSTCDDASTLPCFAVESNTHLYSNAVSETFYDALGRAIETRSPGPGAGHDTIVITVYHDQQHMTEQTVPFQVTSGSGWIDPNGATDYNGQHPGVTKTFYDALGRVLAVRDPNYGSAQEPGIGCSTLLSGTYTSCVNYALGKVGGDTTTYLTVSTVDPNRHATKTLLDPLGRTVYTMSYSGLNSTTLTPIRQTHTLYNVLGEPTSVTVKDLAPQSGQSITSVTTTTAYDDLGRVTSVSDPDQGSWTNSYDAGGTLASTVSGTRTLGYNYDLLGRVGCVQDAAPSANATGACSAGNPLVQNTYDTTFLGKQGSTDFPIGSLTQSVATTSYPEGTSATVTEQFQHDQRGRAVSAQMQLGLPSAWGLTLPTYQAALSYNDADQPITTTTSSNPSGQGSTSTFSYDSTGALAGLSNTTSATPNLATLLYNANGLLDTIQFLSSTGGPLANDQFGYDATLRPTSTTVTWQGGSGQSGTILSQQRSYDNASNVLSLTTTEGLVSGQSGTGGSETQNFCYNEQNQLVWAGNSGTQPAPGNGTCGSATLSSGFTQTGASYNTSFVFTHLGQLWQGPLNGGSTQQQYLYCDSSHPHQLTGLFPVGTTCSNQSGAVYASSYDAWGNVTGRTFSGTTATLSYDTLNHFTEWKASAITQEWYLYDSSGQRVLRRSTSSTGTNTQNIYYYALAGHLIGSLDNAGTRYYLTDALGSILSNITNVAGGASLKGEQLFGPYGNTRYNTPDINTAKGFTGQYQDTTGLDYYGARYYDPVAGVFLSADSAQGNRSGMNPYAYVGGNPETNVDPTGERFVSNGDNGSGVYSSGGGQSGGGLCSYAQYGCGGGGGGLGSGTGWCIYSQAGCGGSSPARVVIPHVMIPHHTAPVFPGVGASSGGQDTPNPCNGLTKTDCMPAIWNTRVRVGGTGMMGVNICEGFCFTFQVPVQYYGETSIGIPGCATAFSCLVHADGGSGSSDTTSDATFGYAGAEGETPAGDAATPAGGGEPAGGEGGKVTIPGNKFRYIFGEATGRAHNIERSNGLALQMERLGVTDDPEGWQLLTDHLTAAALDPTNISDVRVNQWGTFLEKESLFAGPSGRFGLFRSVWEQSVEGNLLFSTLVVLGG